MARDNCGGPIAKDYKGFFLRDDTEIRENANIDPPEAYSLFQDEPYGRVEVFAGSKEWAIEMADKRVAELQEKKSFEDVSSTVQKIIDSVNEEHAEAKVTPLGLQKISKHPFVSTSDGHCSSCGKSKTDQIHGES